MATVTGARRGDRALPGAAGFTLIEVSVAMGLVATSALALAGLIAFSARMTLGSQDQLIASQRAAEAVESVFKSRDTRILTWTQIRNITGASGADGGIFQDGPRDIRDPGPDGLINTADDGDVVTTVTPGPDGQLGTADDEVTPLSGFTREIEIRDLAPNLRQLRVIVRYRTYAGQREYVLTTYVSAFA
jgi:prepilin-type N-terminal cleavage/methylation domain-containing protein